MRGTSKTARILLLLSVLLAAYLIVGGIEGLSPAAIMFFTTGFGIILVVALLLSIIGFEILGSPATAIISTIIPLSISLGLVFAFYPTHSTAYLIFSIAGFTAVAFTRFLKSKRINIIFLSAVHGIAGLIIFLIPIILAIQKSVNPGFLFVSLGGALMGIGGLLFSFLKAGRPILSQRTTLNLLPVNLLILTAAFAAGFKYL